MSETAASETELSFEAGAPTELFDVIVIGAGSGNSIPSPELAGLKIAIVDDGRWFGGTCLNAGCIPTKMFIHPARLVSHLRDAAHLGVTGTASADWAAVRARVFGRIDSISQAGEQYRASGEPNVSLVRERVRFVDESTLVTASGRRLRGRALVIGAGSRPRELRVLPFGPRVISSDDALRLETLPERITIIGGGVVASEFASLYHGFGAKVTQLVRSTVLSSLDADIRATFVAQAGAQWDIREHHDVVDATIPDDATSPIRLVCNTGDVLETDLVLVASGRVPNSDRLGTEVAGFDQELNGRLVVDAHQRVLRAGQALPNVFAMGDIANPHQLKHVANHEARVVAENLRRTLVATSDNEELVSNTLSPVPLAVFSTPEIASFGATLTEARDAGIDAVEVRQDYGGTAWGWALEDQHHFAKLVVDRVQGQILGAHIIGPDAAILLQPLVQAAAFNMPVQGLARGQYWPHPAATEIIENLLLNAKEECNA
ncbi:mycothione reductase [Gulosibacter bifidus]|uniref:Mycothione reductase n=1 Tax=Gulosibacter bifidus TaxID=272239 RepID=A0ABW5RFM4_9MICO|nr:mycothione reductase [Gulosibacter bifidus]